jgi:hypothetical protein
MKLQLWILWIKDNISYKAKPLEMKGRRRQIMEEYSRPAYG